MCWDFGLINKGILLGTLKQAQKSTIFEKNNLSPGFFSFFV